MTEPPPPPPPSGPDMPPPPPPSGGPAGLEPIGPWPRLGARIIDYLVLAIPTLLISLVISGSGGGAFGTDLGFGAWLATIVTTGITIGYFIWLESERGQTVGKMALSYRVIGPDGETPTVEQSARRNAWMLLSIVPLLGGLVQLAAVIAIGVTINGDPFKRGWHDNFAGGTAVVRAK